MHNERVHTFIQEINDTLESRVNCWNLFFLYTVCARISTTDCDDLNLPEFLVLPVVP